MASVIGDELFVWVAQPDILEAINKIGKITGDEKRITIDENLIVLAFQNFAEKFLKELECMSYEAIRKGKFRRTGEFLESMLKKIPVGLEEFLIDRYIDYIISGCSTTLQLNWDGTYTMKPIQ